MKKNSILENQDSQNTDESSFTSLDGFSLISAGTEIMQPQEIDEISLSSKDSDFGDDLDAFLQLDNIV